MSKRITNLEDARAMKAMGEPLNTEVIDRGMLPNPCGRNGPNSFGGEGGIRTPDTVARMPHFECGAFNHSATSPYQ